MILIDLDGHADCASVLTAGAHNATAEPITNVRRVSFLISRPWSCCFLSSREDRSNETSEERGCVTCGTVSATKQVTSTARKTNSDGGSSPPHTTRFPVRSATAFCTKYIITSVMIVVVTTT